MTYLPYGRRLQKKKKKKPNKQTLEHALNATQNVSIKCREKQVSSAVAC